MRNKRFLRKANASVVRRLSEFKQPRKEARLPGYEHFATQSDAQLQQLLKLALTQIAVLSGSPGADVTVAAEGLDLEALSPSQRDSLRAKLMEEVRALRVELRGRMAFKP